jgi:6-pyruvoyltetrahydropterin/6-carboxytetrahydropterin synthase
MTIKGMPDPYTGFVMEVFFWCFFFVVFFWVFVVHKNLNLDVDFLQGKICSTETLAMAIWQQLAPHLPNNVHLHSVKLYETPRIFVEYFG